MKSNETPRKMLGKATPGTVGEFEEEDQEFASEVDFTSKRLKVASAQGTSKKDKSERDLLEADSAEKSSIRSV